jgi:predicted TIM-barrel fold metal-dependent hydrolase
MAELSEFPDRFIRFVGFDPEAGKAGGDEFMETGSERGET